MPPITGQVINSDGFTIDTPKYGPLQVVITEAGNQTIVRVTQDGNVLTEPTITNATIAVVETVINNALNGVVLGVGQTLQDFYVACHIFRFPPDPDPPSWITMISSNDPIPPGSEWWL